jgi:hypothetical protein
MDPREVRVRTSAEQSNLRMNLTALRPRWSLVVT